MLCYAFLFLAGISCSGSSPYAPDERNQFFNFEPETRVLINSPSDLGKPVLLILYALPNGNTIEWTFGKTISPGDDWHFDIQHIAAQTRFLRQALPQYAVVTAYLEAAGKSWPAWRRKYPANADDIARIVDYIRHETGNPQSVILAGHSGGGSFITGFINAFPSIPPYIKRIAYLDANYSYEDSLDHGKKILQWLQADSSNCLSVIAYDDREIVFNGKKVVGPDGGTYRATKRMLQYFVEHTDVTSKQDSTILQYAALNNRARFIIHTNPDTLILHTVLVERNGLIHSVLFNTPEDETEYTFFGSRAYSHYIGSTIPWQKTP